MLACRSKMTKVRRCLAYFVCVIERDRCLCLICYSGEMQHGVSGAAQRHIHSQSIVNRIGRYNVTRTDILFKKLHYLHSGVLGKSYSFRINCGDRAVPGERHPEYLTETVH